MSDFNLELVSGKLTYDGGDGEVVLLGILEETEDIVADDNAGLAGENVLDTHFPTVKSAWISFDAKLRVKTEVIEEIIARHLGNYYSCSPASCRYKTIEG